MNFIFKKEIVENRYVSGYGRLELCSMFTITDNGNEVGRFFHSDEVASFAFGEEDIRINYKRRLLRHTKYPIINQKNNQAIGGYDRREYRGGSTPYGKLFLGDNTFSCKTLENAAYEKDKRLHIRVWVGNYQEAVIYNLKVQTASSFFSTRPAGHAPFEGEISLMSNNFMLLFAGIFLVQQVLDFEDGD